MATVTVLKFPGADTAADALAAIRDLQRRQAITLHDAAIVSWPSGRSKPMTRQLGSSASTNGSGLLRRLLFGSKGRLPGAGLDAAFIRQMRHQISEGTSALFLVTSGAVMTKVSRAMVGVKFEILSTNLTAEQERTLKEALLIK